MTDHFIFEGSPHDGSVVHCILRCSSTRYDTPLGHFERIDDTYNEECSQVLSFDIHKHLVSDVLAYPVSEERWMDRYCPLELVKEEHLDGSTVPMQRDSKVGGATWTARLCAIAPRSGAKSVCGQGRREQRGVDVLEFLGPVAKDLWY